MLTLLPKPDAFNMVCLILLRLLSVGEDARFLCIFAPQMFLMPALITLSIAATRMYRSLIDFCSNDV